jgi:metallo-beta-lactamase family protein
MNCLDDETREVMKDGDNPIWFEGLHTLVTAEESKALNENTEPKVIIASGGMCEGGRIRHHLKHRLWDARNTVLFVGYQAVGTLGRIIHDGAKAVKILGETIEVHAETAVMDSISGHADREGLLGWIGGMQKKPALVFVNHGDDESCTGLAGEIRSRFGVEAAAPYSGSVFDLKKGEWIRLTDPVWRKKEGRRNENTSASREKRSQLYRTLIENAEALVEYAEGMKEHSNGEIRELTEKIRALMKG